MNIRLKSMKRIVMMSAVAAALLAAGCDRGEKTVAPSIETVEFSAEAAEPSPYTVTAAYCRITNADDSTVLTAIERANRERIFGAEATADLQADFDAMVERLAGEYVCCDEELFGTTPETAYVPSAVRITDTGLLLEYQPYEVAPYCVGIVGIELTDDQIAATGAPLIWIDEK